MTNTLQRYAWGSTTAIPELLGAPVDGRPVAEMWLGAHASAPSMTVPLGAADAVPVALSELLRAEPDRLLGRAVVEDFGPRLPYLLKVLAAAQPLSLQVHPKPHVARAGFSRENAAGVPLDSPARTFKDDQHKPEMILALTPFEALCGFRRPEQTLALLDGLAGDLLARMRSVLRAQPTAVGIQRAFEVALRARGADCAADISQTIGSIQERIERGDLASRADQTAVDLARAHPGDPGALVSLMLNRVSLRAGDAVFLADGEVHAYLSGVGVEVMASSDNVLRAAFTAKHVDVAALAACASYAPRAPERPVLRIDPGGLTAYRAPAPEFGLLFGTVAERTVIAHTGPRILLCLDGACTVTGGGGVLGQVARGESVFLAHDAGPVALDGAGTVVVAYVP